MRQIHKIFALLMILAFCGIATISCSKGDDDEPSNQTDTTKNQGGVETSQYIIFQKDYSNFEIESTSTFTRINFVASADWKAEVVGADYVTLSVTEGTASEDVVKMNVKLSSDNEGNPSRSFQVKITANGESAVVTIKQKGSDVVILEEKDIQDLDKFHKPEEFNYDMLRSSSKFSWVRSKQSEHFVCFWEAGYGDDPKTAKHPVDVDDMLQKCEQFYKTNVEKLKMANVGQGKSYLDKYKMEIFILDTDDWTCVGSGYDNVIGALWVNWQPCQPIGSSVAHEVGHSFQYQVFCDKILNGEVTVVNQGYPTADEAIYGYRYGYGPNGDGGCAFWEQCAQWQSFQDYPEQAFDQSYGLFTKNTHRHFHSPWMRYQCYWFQYYFTNKHGLDSYGKLWNEAKYPEDALETYTRLYCGGDLEKFYDEYYDYASRAVIYDYGTIHSYWNSGYSSYNTTMLNVDGKYRPAYANCPSTTGFNIIGLNCPAKGETVSVTLSALATGSALASTDAGTIVNGDGPTGETATNYNENKYFDNQYYNEQYSNYRFGFVAVKNGTATYGTMAKGSKDAVAEMTLSDDYDELYLVVAATPTKYFRQYWNEKETDDMQWPYEVSFTGTNILGFVEIPAGDPEDVTVELTVNCDASLQAYEQGSLNLLSKGVMDKIAVAFKLQPAEIAAAMSAPAVGQTGKVAEGKVTFGLTETTGSVNYKYTANAGFWTNAMGNAEAYGASAPVYVEYTPSTSVLVYGHKGGQTKAGDKYVLKPTFTYMKGGKEYHAVIKLTMQF